MWGFSFVKKFMTKLGLALGSGGARGYAHIGVIKALNEEGWNPEIITGSSIGALVGVLYGYYGEIKKVEEVMLDSYSWEALEMMRVSRSGVMSGRKVRSFLEEFIGDVRLEDLKIPVGVVVTDFYTNEPVLIKKGKASEAVQGSIAFPLFIEPLKVGKRIFWDGGISSQVPTEAARQMNATTVIGVNLNKVPEETPNIDKMSAYAIGVKAIRALQYNMTKISLQEADIEISPILNPTTLLGFGTLIKKGKGKEIIKKGYEEAKKVLKDE